MCQARRYMKCLKCPDRKRHYYYDKSNALQHVRTHFARKHVFEPCPICHKIIASCNNKNSFHNHVVRHGVKGLHTTKLVSERIPFYKFDDSLYESFIFDMRKNAFFMNEIKKFRKEAREARKKKKASERKSSTKRLKK